LASSTEAKPHGVCLIVAYDGTDFAGSQLQLELRTVQSELERAAEIMTGHPTRIRPAGRTDAGVHALAQVVAFDSARLITTMGWFRGLNSALPDDIRVQRVAYCEPRYDPRFDALEKTYRYVVQIGEQQNPLTRERAYQMHKVHALDLDEMRRAAAMLVGTHDFRAFKQADDVRPNTVRTLYAVEVEPSFSGDPTMFAFTVRGTAFMKNMVRIIAGTLIDIGRGRRRVDDVPGMLGEAAVRVRAGHTAPAAGLTLVNIVLGRKGAPSPFLAEPPNVYP